MSETEFMEFSEVDNHDDYYSVDEEGRVHVRDERGCYIMYSAAIDDLRWQTVELVAFEIHVYTRNLAIANQSHSVLHNSPGQIWW